MTAAQLHPEDIGEDPFSELLAGATKKLYKRKDRILDIGDRSGYVYFVLEGVVSLSIESDEGRQIIVGYLEQGQIFGEEGLFGGAKLSCFRATARTNCQIAHIPHSRANILAIQDPEVMYFIGQQVSGRLHSTINRVGDMAFLDVSGRVASTLLEMAAKPDAMTHPDGVQVRITRMEIANVVGSSREMVGRVLKRFADQGLVSVRGSRIVVFGFRHNATRELSKLAQWGSKAEMAPRATQRKRQVGFERLPGQHKRTTLP